MKQSDWLEPDDYQLEAEVQRPRETPPDEWEPTYDDVLDAANNLMEDGEYDETTALIDAAFDLLL